MICQECPSVHKIWLKFVFHEYLCHRRQVSSVIDDSFLQRLVTCLLEKRKLYILTLFTKFEEYH